MSFALLTPAYVEAIHDAVLNPGELTGAAGDKSLDGALARVDNRLAYGLIVDAFDLAAAYAVAIAQGHCFNDGNKRTAFRVDAGRARPERAGASTGTPKKPASGSSAPPSARPARPNSPTGCGARRASRLWITRALTLKSSEFSHMTCVTTWDARAAAPDSGPCLRPPPRITLAP